MKFIEVKGRWINPDTVCVIRPAGENNEGFLTEVLFENGTQMFDIPPEEVARMLNGMD